MKTFFSFMKKEWMEQFRSGRLLFLGILFVLLGVMNPAVAKLTPWLLEMMADALTKSGMVVTSVSVSAMDSWVQFLKNAPMGLIAFLLLESSIFTKEYQSGTLVLALTKGLERYKVSVAKATVLTVFWTVGYGICLGITYGYNAYFWDNSIAQNLALAVFCWYLFGLFTIALAVLFSTLAKTNIGVLAGTGGSVLIAYLIGLFPKLKPYSPTELTDGNALIYGTAEPQIYTVTIVVTAFLCVLCFCTGIWIFNKRQI